MNKVLLRSYWQVNFANEIEKLQLIDITTNHGIIYQKVPQSFPFSNIVLCVHVV